MSLHQRSGILSFIPKKDKDIRYLKNWRHLTLLNTDYNVFAKAIATKLQDVLEQLVAMDQNGCMKGRSTYSNICFIIDVIAYVNEHNLHGILTYIEFQKAFHMVNWCFMQKVLDCTSATLLE